MAYAQNLRLGKSGGGEVTCVVGKGANVGGHSGYGRFVGKVVVVAAKASWEFYKAATGKENGVVAYAQNLRLGKSGGGEVTCVVGKGANVGGHSGYGRFVGKVVVVAAKASWEFYKAATGKENGVVAYAQNLRLG